MDPWNQRAEELTKSVGLSSMSIHGLPASSAGMCAPAGLFSIPGLHPSGQGCAEYSQLVQCFDKMSLSGDVVISASGSSTHTVLGVAELAKVNNAVSEVCFYEGTDAVDHLGHTGNPRYDPSHRGSTQFFHIPPRMIFSSALKSVGIADPLIFDVGVKGAHQVHIQFVCNLPLCLQPGSRFADISGEVCVSFELAEASAIKKAFDHLYKMHNVVLVDSSYHKKQRHRHNARNMYGNVMDGLRIVGNMIQHRLECLDKLDQVEKFAMEPRQCGSNAGSTIVRDVLAFLGSFKHNEMHKIRSFDAMLKRLAASKDDFAERSRSLSDFYRKASIVKAYHSQKNVLALLLKWLRLPECQFCAEPVDGGRFLGAVMLSFPGTQDAVPAGDTCVEADCEESTVGEARSHAARAAIRHLEQAFNVEVVGINHNEAVVAGHESSLISALHTELMLLGASVCKDWEEMLNKLIESVNSTKDAAASIPTLPVMECGLGFATTLSSHYEFVAAKCYALFEVDADKFKSLN